MNPGATDRCRAKTSKRTFGTMPAQTYYIIMICIYCIIF